MAGRCVNLAGFVFAPATTRRPKALNNGSDSANYLETGGGVQTSIRLLHVTGIDTRQLPPACMTLCIIMTARLQPERYHLLLLLLL